MSGKGKMSNKKLASLSAMSVYQTGDFFENAIAFILPGFNNLVKSLIILKQ